MDILSLDLARVTGWARGKAREKPAYGAWELRKPGEPSGLALGELGRRLRDHVRASGKPDLICIERWMSPRAEKAARNRVQGVEDSLRLNGAVHSIAGVYGIEVAEPHPSTVRAQVCGVPNVPGESRRDGKKLSNTKWLVIDTMIYRGLVPKGFAEDNVCDALAGFVWAESNFARVDGSFVLTGR